MNEKQNLGSKILQGIGDTLAPIVKLLVGQVLSQVVFPAFKKADEKAYKTTLASIYVPIDNYVEALAEKTGTQLDDAIVDAFKESIESAALAEGITLPNLDQD